MVDSITFGDFIVEKIKIVSPRMTIYLMDTTDDTLFQIVIDNAWHPLTGLPVDYLIHHRHGVGMAHSRCYQNGVFFRNDEFISKKKVFLK